MAEVFADVSPGLRERKKLRTRETLVQVAMELCLKQGYENTTVEQIATAADVSPRTFSRYFVTKDAVFLTTITDYAEEVVSHLETIPADVGPLEAMRSAHVAVLSRVVERPLSGRLTPDRVAVMLRVINASDALRHAAFEFRHDAVEVLIAKRMGLQVGDRRADLLSTIFSATMLAACGNLLADEATTPLGPQAMIDRMNEAFANVAEFAADLFGSAGTVPG